MGFTYALSVARQAVVSYTALPPLPAMPAVYFCCTVPGVASARRYLASCPVKPGLSSPTAFRHCGSGHLSYLSDFILPSNKRCVNENVRAAFPQAAQLLFTSRLVNALRCRLKNLRPKRHQRQLCQLKMLHAKGNPDNRHTKQKPKKQMLQRQRQP